MYNIETKCIQAGYSPKNGEARVLPIVQSTTFKYSTPEEMGDLFDLKKEGFFYTRLGNPTLAALEEKLNALEGGVGALATSSGMSATLLTVLNVAFSGDNILSASAIYGGTYNLFNITLRKLGIDTKFFDADAEEKDIEKLIDDKTKLIFVETIANPAGIVADFEKLSKIAAKYGILLVVDNTIATPIICRPFMFGANIIVHSTTKYIDGHATSVGGLIIDGGNFTYIDNPRYPEFNVEDKSYHGMIYAKDCASKAFIIKARAQYMRDTGAQMAPMNAYLTCLGAETLHLRMAKHSENALAVARFLKNNKNVEWVNYPLLEGSKEYNKAIKYLAPEMASGMVTFGIKGGREAAMNFQKALNLISIVTHIADVRSCVLHPASTTHRQLSDSDLKDCGISENLVRLSLGIENSKDLIKDIDAALAVSQY